MQGFKLSYNACLKMQGLQLKKMALYRDRIFYENKNHLIIKEMYILGDI